MASYLRLPLDEAILFYVPAGGFLRFAKGVAKRIAAGRPVIGSISLPPMNVILLP
jgi:hypothetical protein